MKRGRLKRSKRRESIVRVWKVKGRRRASILPRTVERRGGRRRSTQLEVSLVIRITHRRFEEGSRRSRAVEGENTFAQLARHRVSESRSFTGLCGRPEPVRVPSCYSWSMWKVQLGRVVQSIMRRPSSCFRSTEEARGLAIRHDERGRRQRKPCCMLEEHLV